MSADWAITGKTDVAAVYGWPVAHSLSPPMQNAPCASLASTSCTWPMRCRATDRRGRGRDQGARARGRERDHSAQARGRGLPR